MTDGGGISAIPPDDPRRTLAVARPGQGEHVRNVALAGGIYTVRLSGADTAGRYCLIEMRVPSGGGPRPHRHDFEESFTVLEGRIEATFRGEKIVVGPGETVNVPANAPHHFRNSFDEPARLLCVCSPAGQDEYFLAVADPVDSPTASPPRLTEAEAAERQQRAAALASRYRTEFMP